MNSSKPIDISKSSLVSLKAELSRKQEEVSNFKANKASNYVCPIINPNKKPLPAVKSKFSKDVEKNAEDGSSSVAEENTKALDHSRNVLEIKSKLYDELKEGRLVSERGRGAEYLVDFTQKTAQKCDDSSSSRKEDVEEQSNSDEDDRPSDPEDDWVDYTDIVGRQRRCLRRDLPAMRAKDADSLLPPPPSPPPPPQLADCSEEDASAVQRPIREVPAAPPHIEAMRRQWRKQEEKLLDKDSVHYEDLLFNEARTHGVGYYAFSTDEAERGRQMRELERRREETLRRQSDAEGLRARRDAQLKARLQAAKARNRQRLGLPPLAPGEETEDSKDNAVPMEKPDENKTDDEKSKKEELEAALKRAAHIRPWDAEKLGLKIVGGGDQPAVMSQSEWVDMKREERISEFAPPQMYNQSRTDVITEPQIDDLSTPQPSESKTLFFTSKRPKAADFFKSQQQTSYQNQAQSSNQYRNEEQSREQYRTHEQSKSSDRFRDVDEEPVKRKRTEIPPPLTAEYFGGTGKPKHKTFAKSSAVGESISEGLKYLDEQKKAKDHKRDKGLLDII